MATAGRPYLITLSAPDRAALLGAADDLATVLVEQPGLPVADLAAALARRPVHRHRLALVAAGVEDVLAGLDEPDGAQVLRGAQEPADPGPVLFLLPGLGDHHPRMAVDLYRRVPAFRTLLDECAELTSAQAGLDPVAALDLTDPDPADPPAPRRVGQFGPATRPAGFDETATAQVLVFAVEYALAQLLRGLGLRPAGLLGHSLGEYVAAAVAGVLALPDAVRLVAGRARLIERTAPGAMLAVLLGPDALAGVLADLDEPDLAVAAVDGPLLCVAAGGSAAVDRLAARLRRDAVASRRLPVRHGFHSPLLRPVTTQFSALLDGFPLAPPRIPVISNVTGTWLTPHEAVSADHWCRHLCGPVRFADCLRTAWSLPGVLPVEVGAGRTLSTLALQHPDRPRDAVVLATLPGPHQPGPDLAALLDALGRAWVAGQPVDLAALAAL